jgi:cellulose synthase (UDP-forming)
MPWPTFRDTTPNDNYQFSYTPHDRRPIRMLIGVGVFFLIGFVWIYFQPQNRGDTPLFVLLSISVVFKLTRLLHEWYHYWNVVPPKPPPAPPPPYRVDVLTTYCPGEPREMVVHTLRAIRALHYPHTAYLCDEADDPYLRQVCAELGVHHVTRTDKTDAKAGNINNALRRATGDLCLVLDPDHVPVPDFLAHVLPYFADPDVGFVQCVQGYYNRRESLVAYGAAEQTYSFYGPMMVGMGTYGTAQAIGANCVFRRAALDSIGGHAAGLSEDMHTAMQLHARGWRSVYVPLPLSYGLVPATLSAYYKQQLKWARGTFELLFTTVPRLFRSFTPRQRLHYSTLPLYYLLGVVHLIDLLIPLLALYQLRLPLRLDLGVFATAFLPLLGTAFLIRQYAQRWLIERHEAGFHVVGGLLTHGTWWVYTLGFLYSVLRIGVPYLPTPKNDRPRNHFWLVLPNLAAAVLTVGVVAYSLYFYGRFAASNPYFQLMIGFGLINVGILSVNVLIGQEYWLMLVRERIKRLSAFRPSVRAARQLAWNLRHGLYGWLRRRAIPLFGGVMLLTALLAVELYRAYRRANPLPHLRVANTAPFYVGAPAAYDLPDGTRRLVAHHVSWPLDPAASLAVPSLRPAEVPVLYLEPALSPDRTEADVRAFLRAILQHRYDDLLNRWFRDLRARRGTEPLLVCFAPAFDEPRMAWGTQLEANRALYSMAWQYVVQYLRRADPDHSLVWVWYPYHASTFTSFYPGGAYVDWLGVRVVNDTTRTPDRQPRSFAVWYQVPHQTIRMHPAYSIKQKPVLVAHLDPGGTPATAARWLNEAFRAMHQRYPTIRGVFLPEPLTKTKFNAARVPEPERLPTPRADGYRIH